MYQAANEKNASNGQFAKYADLKRKKRAKVDISKR
jgi:hypothetical protein